ncbi:MAG: TonB-dependent receptor, partial [Gammaproteobacteria bacterium]|nr:TonB-dependent receptor [Gammaproteobacteria bacterium]
MFALGLGRDRWSCFHRYKPARAWNQRQRVRGLWLFCNAPRRSVRRSCRRGRGFPAVGNSHVQRRYLQGRRSQRQQRKGRFRVAQPVGERRPRSRRRSALAGESADHDGRLEHLFLTGYSAIDRQNFSAGASTFSAEGRRAVFRYQGTWSIDESNTLAFGAEREQLESSNEDLSIDGLFAVHEFKPAANVTLTGGVRSDRHQRFGSELTARLGAAVDLNPNLILRASWGNGFKAPTLFQSTFFCCGATEPNSGLKPESSSAVDAGFEWTADDGRALFGLTAFSQSTENMINFSFTGGGYENIAMVDSTGVEIHGGIALSASMRLNANYAFIDATDGAGDPLIRIPRHSGDRSLDFIAGGAFSGR